MNASREKKQRERRLGEIFFQLSGVSAEIAEERESPDFLLSVEGRHVGLELTEIYVPGDRNAMPAKASESLAAKLVNEARHRYEVQGGKPLHVSVGFVPNTDFRAINRTQTARVLAEFLLKQEVSMDSVR